MRCQRCGLELCVCLWWVQHRLQRLWPSSSVDLLQAVFHICYCMTLQRHFQRTHTHTPTQREREKNTQKHKVKFLCIMYLLVIVLKLTGESVSYCRRLKIFVNKFWGELRTEITVLDGGKKRRIYIYLVIVCAARPYVFAYMDIFLPA